MLFYRGILPRAELAMRRSPTKIAGFGGSYRGISHHVHRVGGESFIRRSSG